MGYGDQGIPWEDGEGNTWAVAVSLAENSVQPDINREICYRFIMWDDSGTPTEVVSPLLEVQLEQGFPQLPAKIGFVRVAACYFGYGNQPEHNYRFVEVTLVFQIWTEDDPVGWKVCIHRMAFDADDFTDIENIAPFWDRTVLIEGEVANYGVMMPDVAYDPRIENGQLYVVYTKYYSTGAAYVTASFGWRSVVNDFKMMQWLENVAPCQTETHNGFHPRIDIGHCTFYGKSGWLIAIAYTGASYSGADNYRPWVSYALVDDPYDFLDFSLPIPSGYTNGAMPTIDIGPPGANSAAVAWTQARSESWNDVTVMVMDTHLHTFILNEIGDDECSSSPSVAVWNTNGSIYRTSVSYLTTENPSSCAWNPAAVRLESDMSGTPAYTIGTPQVSSQDIHGEWDSGSQFTNWYGMSTGLSVFNNNYWMIWSSWQDGQEGLNQVYGAFGYTDP